MTYQAIWTATLYEDLCRMAGSMMAGERAGHPLEPTALAHEAWLRLLRSRNAGSLERGAFLGLAAQAMRRTLTEEARQRATAKRGGGMRRTDLDALAVPHPSSDLALDLAAALESLARIDAELVRMVELRLHQQYSTKEIAAELGTSARTVKRRWRFARAWLRQRMLEDET